MPKLKNQPQRSRTRKSPTRSHGGKKFPTGSVIAVGLAYLLLGWHLSIYGPLWEVFAFIIAGIIALLVNWGTGSLIRLVRLGPRSIFTMLCLSAFVTLAVIGSYIFSLFVILTSADTLLRIEMRAAGYSALQTLGVLLPVGFLGMLCGWTMGRYIVPDGLLIFVDG